MGSYRAAVCAHSPQPSTFTLPLRSAKWGVAILLTKHGKGAFAALSTLPPNNSCEGA